MHTGNKEDSPVAVFCSTKKCSVQPSFSMSAKRARKLTRLGRTAHVTQSGLSHLLRSIDNEGLPSAYSRTSQYRGRRKTCAELTPYGSLTETVTVGHLPIGVQNPFSMIHMCCSHAEGFAKLMRNTLSRVQPPWSIVIYADGITPQDPLSKTDERKIDTVYWSFLEFADALCHEEV